MYVNGGLVCAASRCPSELKLSFDLAEIIYGTAEPVIDLNEEPEEPVVPVAVPEPAVNEKGDEPLNHHEEEIHESTELASTEGLTFIQKMLALGVIVAVCVVFVSVTADARKTTSGVYERVSA